MRSASAARPLPSSTSSRRRVVRTLTSANSARTNQPFSRTKKAARSSPVTRLRSIHAQQLLGLPQRALQVDLDVRVLLLEPQVRLELPLQLLEELGRGLVGDADPVQRVDDDGLLHELARGLLGREERVGLG